MPSQLILRIDPELKDRLSRLAYREGKTTSSLVREVLESYLRERDISIYIDGLWKRAGDRMRAKGFGPKDVGKAVREVRKGTAG